MKIKVTVENAKKIGELLGKVNGKNLTHTYSTIGIINFSRKAEKALEKMYLPKKYRKGATAHGISAENVAKCYKYSRIANRVELVRGSSCWFIVSLTKFDAYPTNARDRVQLTDDQKKIVIATIFDEATAI